MAFKKPSLVLSLLILSLLQFSEARKTYIIKEKITSGELKVMQPRVQSTSSEWCWFESVNGDNSWCMTGDETWTLGYVNEYNYQQDRDTTNDIPENFLATLTYESKQNAAWDSTFNLQRMLYNKLSFAMNEFKYGFRFEMYYWISEYAFCFNVAHFIEALTMTFITESSVVQCKKTMIDCFDDWTIWTDEEAKYFECSQSSTAAVTLYNYQPILSQQDNYLLGYNKYIENFCWPGYSPFYSYFYKYPNNLQYGFVQMVNAFNEFYVDFFTAGWKKSETKEPVKVESAAFSYYNLCFELVEFFRSAIMYDGEKIIRKYSMQELSKLAENDFNRRFGNSQ